MAKGGGDYGWKMVFFVCFLFFFVVFRYCFCFLVFFVVFCLEENDLLLNMWLRCD